MQIAKYINNLGYRTHRGNKFENRTVEYILTNPVYIGYARWTPTHKIKRGQASTDTIIKKSQHAPIVSEEIFYKVNELIKHNKEIHKKYHKSTASTLHWLNGLIKCKYCGHTLIRNTKDFYQCSGYTKGKCLKSQMVKIGAIENVILHQIKDDFTKNLKINYTTRNNSDSEMSILISELGKMKEKEQRIKEAYMNGIDSLEEYKENKKFLQTQKIMLEKQLNKLKNKKNPSDNENTIKEQLKTVYNILIDNKVDMQRKYEVSHLIIDKIVFARDEGTLELTYKQ